MIKNTENTENTCMHIIMTPIDTIHPTQYSHEKKKRATTKKPPSYTDSFPKYPQQPTFLSMFSICTFV
eukprot:Pgem_evm1s276